MTAAAAEKKKGRPRKTRRGRPPRALPQVAEPRRTLRPRRRRALLDDFANFDDYFEEDDEEEEEEPERKMRKLKLVLKLPHASPAQKTEGEGDRCFSSRPTERVSPSSSSSHVDDEEPKQEEDMKLLKKRLDGSDDRSGDRESGRKNVRRRSMGFVSGVSGNSLSGTPIPERKLLESILDKLQKKDTYGVFAEPVDPEELPDYHDVIEHPMDFGTIRKKLCRNDYHSLEQFEDDVFLICSNAMQYNAPDTIYFRQACTIQDMGRKEFQKLRSENKCTITEWKAEEINRCISIEKKPTKKSLPKTAVELLGSDLSSAATLASMGEAGTGLMATQTNGEELSVAGIGFADGSSSLGESKSDKADEHSVSAKGSPSRHGKKLSVVDESRRFTYNIVDQQLMIEPESVFDVLESEQRQLVAVGLHAEYSYARSLASFAATVGPIGWKIVSQRIESALPAGIKFGPGWVGEFEPLPVPVLSLENSTQNQANSNSNLQFKMPLERSKETEVGRKARRHGDLKGARPNLHYGAVAEMRSKASDHVEKGSYLGGAIELKQGLFSGTAETQLRIACAMTQQQKEQSCVNFPSNASDQVQKCLSSSMSCIPIDRSSQKSKMCAEVSTSRSPRKISWDRKCLKQEPLELAEAMTPHNRNHGSKSDVGDLSRKVSGNSEGSLHNSAGFISKHQSGLIEKCIFSGIPYQGFGDPSRSMGLSSKLFSQPKIPNRVNDSLTSLSTAPPTRGETCGTTAPSAWISVGTSRQLKPSAVGTAVCKDQVGSTSFCSSIWRVTDPSLTFDDPKKQFNSQAFIHPIKVFNEEPRFHNKGLFIFPQLVPTDLSRYQGQIPSQGPVSSNQQKHNRTLFPPDLNISFHPPGSPVRHSAGVLKDSQQPDLALQL